MPAHHMVSGEYQKSTLVEWLGLVERLRTPGFGLSIRMHWHFWQGPWFPRSLWRFGPFGLEGWLCCNFSNQHGRCPARHGVGKSPPQNCKYSTQRFCCTGILGTGTPLTCPCVRASSTGHVPALRCCLGTGRASDPSVSIKQPMGPDSKTCLPQHQVQHFLLAPSLQYPQYAVAFSFASIETFLVHS